MNVLRKLTTVSAIVLAGGLWTSPVLGTDSSTHGVMTVEDGGHVFSTAGVKKAKSHFEGTSFKSTTHFTVVTYDKVPASKRADFDLVKADRDRKRSFMRDWALDAAKSHHEKGVFVLICVEASSVRTVVDRQTDRDRGFSDEKAKKVDDAIVAGFKEAANKTGDDAKLLHDAALMKATEYVVDELKDTAAVEKTNHSSTGRNTNSGGSSIMSYICIGIAILLGIWLVVGLVRAFTGGGGGGMMGGGGYGGGGGGFFSSLIGGMFGAAAGMWMYDHFFGHGGSSMAAGDYGSAGADNADTGAGDFDGGADGGGGDWGDSGGGDAGGGDWGGGDGGGGDFGGGGGDFGGGDW